MLVFNKKRVAGSNRANVIIGVVKMRMLRWMCGWTKQNMIINDKIRENVGVTPIVEKIVETRLRWFGHVEKDL